jgi:hypothetical protein
VVAWLAFWAGFAALDLWADSRGQSLSTTTQHLFRTHHPVGRAAFTVALGSGAVVLWRHIVRR